MLVKRLTIIVSVIVFFILVFTFGSIYTSVSYHCEAIQVNFGTDCVEGSIKVLESDEYTIKERNEAIYVLGQLADSRALPILESFYEGPPGGKEPLDEVLSQYELQKAIKWCKKGNATSWMYSKYK